MAEPIEPLKPDPDQIERARAGLAVAMKRGGHVPVVLQPGETVKPQQGEPWQVPQLPGADPNADSVPATLKPGDEVVPKQMPVQPPASILGKLGSAMRLGLKGYYLPFHLGSLAYSAAHPIATGKALMKHVGAPTLDFLKGQKLGTGGVVKQLPEDVEQNALNDKWREDFDAVGKSSPVDRADTSPPAGNDAPEESDAAARAAAALADARAQRKLGDQLRAKQAALDAITAKKSMPEGIPIATHAPPLPLLATHAPPLKPLAMQPVKPLQALRPKQLPAGGPSELQQIYGHRQELPGLAHAIIAHIAGRKTRGQQAQEREAVRKQRQKDGKPDLEYRYQESAVGDFLRLVDPVLAETLGYNEQVPIPQMPTDKAERHERGATADELRLAKHKLPEQIDLAEMYERGATADEFKLARPGDPDEARERGATKAEIRAAGAFDPAEAHERGATPAQMKALRQMPSMSAGQAAQQATGKSTPAQVPKNNPVFADTVAAFKSLGTPNPRESAEKLWASGTPPASVEEALERHYRNPIADNGAESATMPESTPIPQAETGPSLVDRDDTSPPAGSDAQRIRLQSPGSILGRQRSKQVPEARPGGIRSRAPADFSGLDAGDLGMGSGRGATQERETNDKHIRAVEKLTETVEKLIATMERKGTPPGMVPDKDKKAKPDPASVAGVQEMLGDPKAAVKALGQALKNRWPTPPAADRG